MRHALTLAAVALFALTGCLRLEQLDLEDFDIGMLSERPLLFLHHEVELAGKVDDRFGPRAFTVQDPSLLDRREVLVIVPPGPTPLLEHDQRLRVNGVVRQYVADELARDFPDLALDEVFPLIRYEWAAPVIIAERVWL